jgi:hypothetical protein
MIELNELQWQSSFRVGFLAKDLQEEASRILEDLRANDLHGVDRGILYANFHLNLLDPLE